MAETHQKQKATTLAGLLKRIEIGDNLKRLCHEAGELANQIDPADIARAEQTLIDSGYTPHSAHQLSTAFVFMGMYDQQTRQPQGQLPGNHILRRITAEHDLFRCFNADLRDVTEDIVQHQDLTDVSADFRTLVDTVRHLQSMEDHMLRETDMIFPYLCRQGYMPLCRAAEKDHVQLRRFLDDLMALVLSFNGMAFDDFQMQLASTVQRLCPLLEEHLAFEDGLLYPMALVVIDNEATWKTIKALCEQVGYGGVHH
ncbi:hemerythrin domain-containing protein [Planctomycetota bacterium]